MASMTMHAVRPVAADLDPSQFENESPNHDALPDGPVTAVDTSQFDSETEDYDALPSGPATAAVLIVTAIFAIPVLAASLAIVPVTWAARSVAGIFGSGKSTK